MNQTKFNNFENKDSCNLIKIWIFLIIRKLVILNMEGTLDDKEMNIKDHLYLSPFEKYKLYGIFPWKFVLAMLLLILTTAQVVLIVNNNANYSYKQIIIWNDLFLNSDVQGSDTSLTNTFNLFHTNRLKSFIDSTIEVLAI